MVCEGAMALLPATLSESPCSEGSKHYIRNVVAVGSSPITSTKSPVQRLESGNSGSSTSAHERYVEFVEVGGLSPSSHSESRGHRAGGVARRLYRQHDKDASVFKWADSTGGRNELSSH